jgi:hypothetical protein
MGDLLKNSSKQDDNRKTSLTSGKILVTLGLGGHRPREHPAGWAAGQCPVLPGAFRAEKSSADTSWLANALSGVLAGLEKRQKEGASDGAFRDSIDGFLSL